MHFDIAQDRLVPLYLTGLENPVYRNFNHPCYLHKCRGRLRRELSRTVLHLPLVGNRKGCPYNWGRLPLLKVGVLCGNCVNFSIKLYDGKPNSESKKIPNPKPEPKSLLLV